MVAVRVTALESVKELRTSPCWGCVITAIATRDRDGYYSNGGVGVDLTVLWFYGVSPWPVALSPLPCPSLGAHEAERAGELALALVECGTGKSRSARLRLVPMHSFLPLLPSSAFSRPLVSLSFLSLFLSVSSSPPPSVPFLSIRLSRSLFLVLSLSRTDTSLRTSTHSTFHLVPLLALSF